nr:hypothetical protein [Clostridium sp. WB02_MRS01]
MEPVIHMYTFQIFAITFCNSWIDNVTIQLSVFFHSIFNPLFSKSALSKELLHLIVTICIFGGKIITSAHIIVR